MDGALFKRVFRTPAGSPLFKAGTDRHVRSLAI
jgi:hypothetical protein